MRSRPGYTLIEVLIVTGLIITLATIGTTSFLESLRQSKESRAFTKLQELAAMQQVYFRDFDRFATFAELQEIGYIAAQYVEDDVILHNPTTGDGSRGGAFIPDYQLDFAVQAESFRITATAMTPPQAVTARWRLQGRNEDLRGMYVTEDGVVRFAKNQRPVK